MVAAAETVIAGEYDQGLLSQSQLLQSVEKPSYVRVHRRHRGEIPLQHLPVVQTALAQALPLRPRMDRLLRAGIEAAVVIRVHQILRMAGPRTVRGGVVHAQIEWILIFGALTQKTQGVVGDQVGDVSRLGHQLAISNHRRAVVVATPRLMYVPVVEAVLHQLAVAQMPFAAQPAPPPMLGQYVGVRHFPLQIGGRVRPHVPSADPVVDAMLGGNPSGQEIRPARRAHRRCCEEVLEPHARGCDPVDAGGADLLVPVTPRSPGPLVVGEDEEDVRTVCHLMSSHRIGFCLVSNGAGCRSHGCVFGRISSACMRAHRGDTEALPRASAGRPQQTSTAG